MNIEYTYEENLSLEQKELVEKGSLLSDWLKSIKDSFVVHNIHVQSADFILRNDTQHLLFLKIKSTTFDLQGNPVNGIVFLRGGSVAALCVLKKENEKRLLMVRQPRLGVGLDLLEIPAGMMDGEADPKEVMVKELWEECGIKTTAHDLKPLFRSKVHTSVGIADESMFLFALEIEVKDFAAFDQKLHGATDENERIITEVIHPQDLFLKTTDSKSIMAYALYEGGAV